MRTIEFDKIDEGRAMAESPILSLTLVNGLPEGDFSRFLLGFIEINRQQLTSKTNPYENRGLKRSFKAPFSTQPLPLAGNHT